MKASEAIYHGILPVSSIWHALSTQKAYMRAREVIRENITAICIGGNMLGSGSEREEEAEADGRSDI